MNTFSREKGLGTSTGTAEMRCPVDLGRLRVDEWAQRWEQMSGISSVSVWRSPWRRFRQCECLLVNKSILTKVTICFSLSFFITIIIFNLSSPSLSCTHSLPSLAPARLLSTHSLAASLCKEKRRPRYYQRSDASNLIARPRVATLQLSLDSSRYPELHASRDGHPFLQLAAVGPLPARHPACKASQHSSPAPPSAVPPYAGEETVTVPQLSRRFIQKHLANTYVQWRKKHAYKMLRCKLAVRECLV